LAGIESGGAQLARHRARDRGRKPRLAGPPDSGRRRKSSEGRRQAMNASTFVVDHHEDVGGESPRRRGERQHGVEARAISSEQHDATQP